MNFIYDPSGTAQQQNWAQRAVAACSFPLSAISANVTFVWVPQMPSNADTRHPYMVTEVDDATDFTVYIATWADDPTNPNNLGLPNPAQDIYDFYCAAIVHELGHVVIDSTFNPGGTDTDPRVQTMCSYFWTPTVDSGSGRRYGTINDWDAGTLTWAEEIREAVAECFKCAFYQGDPIFLNRTQWNIDEATWGDYLALIAIPSGFEEETFTLIDAFPNPDPYIDIETNLSPSLGGFLSLMLTDRSDGGDQQLRVFLSADAATSGEGVSPAVAAVYVEQESVQGDGDPNGSNGQVFGLYTAGPGMEYTGIFVEFDDTPDAPGDEPPPTAPYWMGVLVTESGWQAGIWNPALHPDNWQPDLSTPPDTVYRSGDESQPVDYAYFELTYGNAVNASGGAGSITLKNFLFQGDFYGFVVGFTASAPYPFGTSQGSIDVSPGYRGAVILEG